jgi:hypothetical protein
VRRGARGGDYRVWSAALSSEKGEAFFLDSFFDLIGLPDETSTDIKRWVLIGYCAERNLKLPPVRALEIYLKKAGRPKKSEYQSKDSQRVFELWRVVRALKETRPNYGLNEPVRIEVPELVKLCQQIFKDDDLFSSNASPDSIIQSVSRGRKKLKIDIGWRSEICEKLLGDISQMTDDTD